MPRHTAADIRQVLDAITAEQPGRKDLRVANRQTPRYLTRGAPSCLVAEVLDRLGVSRGVLRDLDRAGPQRIDGTAHPLRRRFTPEAWALLGWLQRANDRGWDTWRAVAADAFRTDDPHRGVFTGRHPWFWAERPWLTPPTDRAPPTPPQARPPPSPAVPATDEPAA